MIAGTISAIAAPLLSISSKGIDKARAEPAVGDASFQHGRTHTNVGVRPPAHRFNIWRGSRRRPVRRT
jgi:hypothetical protein